MPRRTLSFVLSTGVQRLFQTVPPKEKEHMIQPPDPRAEMTRDAAEGILAFVRAQGNLYERTRDELVQIREKLNVQPGSQQFQDKLTTLAQKKEEIENSVGMWAKAWKPEGPEAYVLNQVARLWHIPRLHLFHLSRSNASLFVRTSTLYGCNPAQSTWYRIGEMEIMLPLRASLALKHTQYRNLTHTIEKGNPHTTTFCAPQIRAEGRVGCWGSTGPVLKTALESLNFFDATAAAIRFAECTEHMQGYEGWPVVDRSEVPQWYRNIPKECW